MAISLTSTNTSGAVNVNGVDVLTVDAGGNVIIPRGLGGAGAISGDKNRVINGSCQIVNTTTFVASNNTSGYGGPEMFIAVNDGAGGQFTQSQASLTFGGLTLPTVRQTVNTANTNITAANHWRGIGHRFEGSNVFDLRGKPVVASFVFNANFTGIVSVSLSTVGGTAQSYVTTISVTANTPTLFQIPLGVIPSAATINNNNTTGIELYIGWLNTGTFQTGTLNQWQTGFLSSATGATNWGATAGNFIELTNLQLEEGTVASPFVRRGYGHELALTQRYYESTYELGIAPGTVNGAGIHLHAGASQATAVVVARVSYKQQKRTIPTVTYYNPSTGALGSWQYGRSGVAGQAISMVANDGGTYGHNATSASVGAAYVTAEIFGHWVASARL